MPKHVIFRVYMTFVTDNEFAEQKFDQDNEKGNESKCVDPFKNKWIPKAVCVKTSHLRPDLI